MLTTVSHRLSRTNALYLSIIFSDVADGSPARAIPRRGSSASSSATPGLYESPSNAFGASAGGPAQLATINVDYRGLDGAADPNELCAPMGTPIPPATSEPLPPSPAYFTAHYTQREYTTPQLIEVVHVAETCSHVPKSLKRAPNFEPLKPPWKAKLSHERYTCFPELFSVLAPLNDQTVTMLLIL